MGISLWRSLTIIVGSGWSVRTGWVRSGSLKVITGGVRRFGCVYSLYAFGRAGFRWGKALGDGDLDARREGHH
eukprot:829495-Amorphochlora_amoeboformis.AAC.1